MQELLILLASASKLGSCCLRPVKSQSRRGQGRKQRFERQSMASANALGSGSRPKRMGEASSSERLHVQSGQQKHLHNVRTAPGFGTLSPCPRPTAPVTSLPEVAPATVLLLGHVMDRGSLAKPRRSTSCWWSCRNCPNNLSEC